MYLDRYLPVQNCIHSDRFRYQYEFLFEQKVGLMPIGTDDTLRIQVRVPETLSQGVSRANGYQNVQVYKSPKSRREMPKSSTSRVHTSTSIVGRQTLTVTQTTSRMIPRNTQLKRNRANFRSGNRNSNENQGVQMDFYNKLIPMKSRLAKKLRKTDSHELFAMTFQACKGYRYISYNLSKHPKHMTRSQIEYQHPHVSLRQSVMLSAKASKKASIHGYQFTSSANENMYPVSKMFLGHSARSDFDKKADKLGISKLTLLSHTGKPLRYVLKNAND